MGNEELKPCEGYGYKESDFSLSNRYVIVLKGYWIWWCKKHRQPTAWCENDALKKKIQSLEEKLSEINNLSRKAEK